MLKIAQGTAQPPSSRSLKGAAALQILSCEVLVTDIATWHLDKCLEVQDEYSRRQAPKGDPSVAHATRAPAPDIKSLNYDIEVQK